MRCPRSLPDARPIDIVGEILGDRRETGNRLGRKFDLQRLVPDSVGHGDAGHEFTHAPLIQLEPSQAPTRLGVNLFDLDAPLVDLSPLDGLRPFPAALDNCETHDILPCLVRLLAEYAFNLSSFGYGTANNQSLAHMAAMIRTGP